MVKKKIVAVIIIVCIIIFHSIMFFNYIRNELFSGYSWGSSFQKTIDHIYSAPDELTAIGKAEFLNYTNIFNISKYRYNETPDISSKYGFARAQYIDKAVIDYYINRIDYQKQNQIEVHTRLNYTVRATLEKTITLNLTKDKWDRAVIVVKNLSGEIITEWPIYQYYGARYNNTDIQTVDLLSINTTFTQSYIVSMTFSYGEGWGGTCGHWFTICQLIIVDKNYSPKFVFINDMGDTVA